MVNKNEKYKDHITFIVYRDYTIKTNKKQIIKRNIVSKITRNKKDIQGIEELLNNNLSVDKKRCIITFYGDPTPYIVKGNYNEIYEDIYGEDIHKNPSIIEVKGFRYGQNSNKKKNK
jgi:hypothetical protein